MRRRRNRGIRPALEVWIGCRRGLRGVGSRLVLLPARPSPFPPREIVHDTFGGAVALRSPCRANAVDEEGNEGEERGQ